MILRADEDFNVALGRSPQFVRDRSARFPGPEKSAGVGAAMAVY
jgi:hypothetical protein